MSTAVAASGCFDVIGVDQPTAEGLRRVQSINRGAFPFVTADRELADATLLAAKNGLLRATTDLSVYAKAEIVLVDIGLDLDRSGDQPTFRFEPFRIAVREIAGQIRAGTLVIIETTVPPGTCEKVVAPILAECMQSRGFAEDSFYLAHSYERVMPGKDYLKSIIHSYRCFAGHTPEAGRRCRAFLEKTIDTRNWPPIELSSTLASETAKVLENSYRATNIAFIDEWSAFAERRNIDLFEVIEAVRVRPTHSNIMFPGLGVGGYCLTKDPLFAAVSARELFQEELTFPFCESAVRRNEQMPIRCLEVLDKRLVSLKGKRIGLFGLSYRPDVADTRHSPSETFYRAATARGAEFQLHDPFVTHWEETGLPVSNHLPRADQLDAVVFAVSHSAYRELDISLWAGAHRPLLFDANGVLTAGMRRRLRTSGFQVYSIGRGEDV